MIILYLILIFLVANFFYYFFYKNNNHKTVIIISIFVIVFISFICSFFSSLPDFEHFTEYFFTSTIVSNIFFWIAFITHKITKRIGAVYNYSTYIIIFSFFLFCLNIILFIFVSLIAGFGS